MLPMNGNYNQYDPTEMFRDWIQKMDVLKQNL